MKARDIKLIPARARGTWDTEVGGRTFQVSKSQFGWHVAETTNGKYIIHVFGPVHDSKADALQAIIDNIENPK